MKIDHVEVFVPSRREAAEWYATALGLTPVEAHRDWAASDQGPLMISADEGETKVALFRGPAQDGAPPRGWRRLAFTVSAQAFLDFLDASGTWRDPPLGSAEIQDHGASISVYFQDPYGNDLEVTTYEAEAARSRLR